MKFIADFDVAAMQLSVAALIIMLYFGVAYPQQSQARWVSFAFWGIGFLGSLYLGLVKRTASMSMKTWLIMALMVILALGAFVGLNLAYGSFTQGSINIGAKLDSFALGIAEELFFGVFLLGLLINWLRVNPIFAILGTSAVHSYYHVPNWGSSLPLLLLFFISFTLIRCIYVFYFRKVGFLLAAHGFWNWGVG